MKEIHYLAAEVYGYSYDNYQEKIEMGHVRFTKYMPDSIRILIKAENENWDDEKLANKLEIDIDQVNSWKNSFRNAQSIVKGEHAGDSFKIAIRKTILDAVESGLSNDEEIETLIEQIYYRTNDFGFLLNKEGRKVSDYSIYLRFGDID